MDNNEIYEKLKKIAIGRNVTIFCANQREGRTVLTEGIIDDITLEKARKLIDDNYVFVGTLDNADRVMHQYNFVKPRHPYYGERGMIGLKMKAFCNCNSTWKTVNWDITKVDPSQLIGKDLLSGSLGLCPTCGLYRWHDAYYENEQFDKMKSYTQSLILPGTENMKVFGSFTLDEINAADVRAAFGNTFGNARHYIPHPGAQEAFLAEDMIKKEQKSLVRHALYALYKCMYHWETIAVGGTKCTHFRDRKIKTPAHHCYMCEYAILNAGGHFDEYARDSHRNVLHCQKCPLLDYAWKKADDYDTKRQVYGTICEQREDSPYYKYCQLKPAKGAFDDTLIWDKYEKLLRGYANEIVDACKRAIRDLELANIRKSK